MKVPQKLLDWQAANPERVKESAKARLAKWREANPEKYREQQLRGKENAKAYYQRNKERWRESQLRNTYGITLEQYNLLLEEQNGRCAICFTDVCPSGKAFAVDHCHETGEIRGLLCGNCNTALGLLKHDPARLRQAARYLKCE